jgi:DNA-binding NtrC family response regulator
VSEEASTGITNPAHPLADPIRVIVVDDEEAIGYCIREYFDGFSVTAFSDPRQALEALKKSFFDIAIVDYRMPYLSGLDLMIEARRSRSYHFGILLTAFADKDLLAQFISHNLIRVVLEKPLDLKSLKSVVDGAAEECRRAHQDRFAQENMRLHYEQLLADTFSAGAGLIGMDGGLRSIAESLRRFADSAENLLLTGETGTGKEALARAVHALSQRRSGPFVKVNCGAMPESLIESELFGYAKGAFSGAYQDRKGKVETANGGTLFLDEIAELKLELQSRLLHVVQDRVVERLGSNTSIRVDFRLISATNRDLPREVENGGFRRDLYHRISTLPLHIPPLRERMEDLPQFLDHYLSVFSRELNRGPLRISEAAMAVLQSYEWPGNVRELENVLKRSVILARPGQGTLDADLFAFLHGPGIPRRPLKDDDGRAAIEALCELLRRRSVNLKGIERLLLEELLRQFKGDVMAAARQTGVPKDKLYRLKQDGQRK